MCLYPYIVCMKNGMCLCPYIVCNVCIRIAHISYAMCVYACIIRMHMYLCMKNGMCLYPYIVHMNNGMCLYHGKVRMIACMHVFMFVDAHDLRIYSDALTLLSSVAVLPPCSALSKHISDKHADTSMLSSYCGARAQSACSA